MDKKFCIGKRIFVLLSVAVLLFAMSPGCMAAQEDIVAVVVETLPYGLSYGEAVADALSGGGGVYGELETALLAATPGETVVLVQESYTMTESVVVPGGVLLLLPCDENYKAYENNGYNPDGTKGNGTVGISPISTVISTLNIPSGVTLTVNGSVLVNAVTGRPSAGHFDQDINGGYSRVILDGDIVINAGGKLDVCGIVTGAGQVTALYGAAVHDLYVVRNWRGGSQAYEVTLGYNLYPMNEIDCHNIQTTLRVNHGATYSGTVKMYASGSYYYTRFPQIDNNNGLIRLATGGYAIKTYDPSGNDGTGRSTINIYGGATASRSTLNIVGIDLSTGGFLYPVNGNLTLVLNSGSYFVDESFKFLTGAKLYVAGDASLTLNSGKILVFYDEFVDVPNAGTLYPIREPAVVQLQAGARFVVNGTFAGRISSDAENGVAQVTFSDRATLGVTTQEANGLYNGVRDLEFEALLFDQENSYDPEVGKTYFYSNGWLGGSIPAGQGECTLNGEIALQGRTNHSGAEITLNGNDTYTCYTQSDGTFSFNGVNTGMYTMKVTCQSYLSYEIADVQVSGSGVSIDLVTLIGGDVNSDGKIDITDLNILFGNYQHSGAGDVNGDGKVDITDLNVLLSNYQKSNVVD